MSDESISSFAATLRAWRATHRLSQAEAAAWLAVPVRTLQKWELGRAPAGADGPLRKLMGYYGRD